jgi:hypothetical protein
MIKKLAANRTNIFYLILLVIILTSVYLITLLPGTGYMGDTAKFQFIGKILGTPHAPGYPNYILLNHFFVTLFPIGSLAFRANFLSSVYTILTSIVLYRLFNRLGIRSVVAFSVIAAFCLGKTVWNQSVIAEVYTLNLLYTAVVVTFFISWNLTGKDRYFYLACFFYAISFGNHLLMIGLLPAIIYIVLATDARSFISPKKIILVVVFIILGMSQYFYLYLRTISPDTQYLETSVQNFSEFVFLITGGESKSEIFQWLSLRQTLQKIQKFAFFFVRELLIFIPLPFIGFFKVKKNKIKGFLGLGFLGNLLLSFSYNIDDVWVYLIPSYMFLAVLTGLFLEYLCRQINPSKLRTFSLLIILLPLIFLVVNLQRNNMSHATSAAEFTEKVLDYIGKDGFIINPSYDEFEYLKYYLIGEELAVKNNIQMISIDEALRYLEIEDPNLRNKIRIFVLEPNQADQLEQAGFSSDLIFPNFYQVK